MNNYNLHKISIISSIALFSLIVLAATVWGSGDCLAEHSMINPRFECGNDLVIEKGEYTLLKKKLISYIEDAKKEGRAELVSVYFRDLESGPTMGINERVDFIPASLLKLPLALTYFRMAESDQNHVRHNVKYDDIAKVPEQTFKPQNPIEKGKEYSVEVLIEYMIMKSDNLAAQLLFEHLKDSHDIELLSETYRDLGIIDIGSDIHKEAVNAKGYGSIFRQLYNVSYLDPHYSEKLLTLLSKSEFKEGLAAGVPGNVVVAHKFGERYLDDGSKQLHDCGIVYYPSNPYLLCIMTAGSDFNSLKEIIAYISNQFYLELDSRKI